MSQAQSLAEMVNPSIYDKCISVIMTTYFLYKSHILQFKTIFNTERPFLKSRTDLLNATLNSLFYVLLAVNREVLQAQV